jgi:hypothetical protein
VTLNKKSFKHLYNDEKGRLQKWFHDFWILVEGVMIFKICKCKNRNFSQAKVLNFEGLLRYQNVKSCYNFWICCESLNEENFKTNFISFGIKLKEL